jgi:hypothetical protein
VNVCGKRVHSQMAKALPADGRDRSLREDHGHARGLAVRGSIVIVLSLDVVRKLGRNLAEDLVFGLGRGVPSATSLAMNFFSWALSRCPRHGWSRLKRLELILSLRGGQLELLGCVTRR